MLTRPLRELARVLLPGEAVSERSTVALRDSSFAESGEQRLALTASLRQRLSVERLHRPAALDGEPGDEAPVSNVKPRNRATTRVASALVRAGLTHVPS